LFKKNVLVDYYELILYIQINFSNFLMVLIIVYI